ncbi:hypothetical protein SMICM17S_10876 [Streptomyces microflavus]
MTKQTILGRVTQLAKANINALLDQAEDPQKMLDQLIRDYTSNIAEAEQAVAATIGNLRLMEQDHKEDVEAAAEWGSKALAASRKADELRGRLDLAERSAIAHGEPNGKRCTEPSAGGRSWGPGPPLPATAVGSASATALAWATRRSSAEPPPIPAG